MRLWNQIRLAGCLALSTVGLRAQVTSNSLMPPQINMTQSGWNNTLQNGNLTFGMPVAVVPGEVPIPVAFGLNATFLTRVWTTRVYDPDLGKSVPVLNEIDRPAVGGVHFGYISDAANYGGTTVEGLTVLEDGNQISDSRWTTFSSNATLGTVLNLPQAYGFSAVSTSVAKADPTATYLSYTTTAAGLGTTYQSIVQGLAPSGFGTNSTSYKVVLDKNKARVYAYAASAHAWAPVLWADRFGHYVTFQWLRSTTGLPAGITAITKVTATNQRSKGVVLRWADYASNTVDSDILRVDFVGVHAPSVLVKGYSSYSYLHPVNAVDPLADNVWTVVPSPIGSLCRPTSIQVGAFGSLPQPSWSGASAAAALGPGAPPVDGTSDSSTRGWFFAYDGNLAELATLTEPNGVTTTFVYANYSGFTRGVSEARAVDLNLRKQTMRWTRTFSTPLSIKVEGWWDPDKMATPDRYHQIVFPTDGLNYGNGVPQTDTLLDTGGKAWSTTTYTYKSVGGGLNATLSSVQSVSIQGDGVPTITTSLGYPNSTNLQVTQQDVSVTDAGGISHAVSSTVNTYASRWDMLEGRQLTQTVTTRYKPDGSALSSITQNNVYDPPTSGAPLLQLQKSYLDGGTTGQHGTIYSYDSEGRPYTQNVHHLEGAVVVDSPNTRWVTYDSASGAVASLNVANQPTLSPILKETRSGFDAAGRPTVITDSANVATTYTYDDQGRVLLMSRPGNPAVTYEYPVVSIGGGGATPLKVTTNGQVTTTNYDGFGRVIQSWRPSGIGTNGATTYTTQTPTFDAYGRPVELKEVNPAGASRAQSWAYDPLDRVISQTPYAGGGTTMSYSTSGIYRLTTTTLSGQISSTTWTDPLGQVVEMDAPGGTTTKATYDGAGHRVSLTIKPVSGLEQIRTWFYDALGRMTSKWEPETNTQVFGSFNALNQPTSVIEADGTGDKRIRTVAFDGFGRTLSVTNGSDSLLNTYTGPNLTSATRTVGGVAVSQSFAYNGPGGRLSSETTTQPGLTTVIGYTYDVTTGHLNSLSYPSGRVIGYGYDALNRVTSITNNGATLVSSVKFDDWGNRYQTIFASTSQDTWAADPTGTRLNTWSISYPGGGLSKVYQYDNIKNVLMTAGEWTLTHDDLGHLTEADGFGITTTHTYDAFGNATTHTAAAVTSPVPPAFNNFAFNPLVDNQVPSQDKNNVSTGWNTNKRGEATLVGAAMSSSTVLGLSWDGLGLVKSIVWNAGNQSFLYAPSGMRVSLTDAMTSTNNRKYAYTTQGLLLSEWKNPPGTPTWNRDVVYLGSKAVAEIDGNGVHELHSDHLGSPRLITSGNGSVEGTQAYGPYGELISQDGYIPLTGYTGHLQTDVSGLIYMRGRYYSPAWHAFVNSDQGVDPRIWNQRAYVGGSPFMLRDPSGMIIQVPEVDMQFYKGYYMMLWLAASAGGIKGSYGDIRDSKAESTGDFYSGLFTGIGSFFGFGSDGYIDLVTFSSVGQFLESNGDTISNTGQSYRPPNPADAQAYPAETNSGSWGLGVGGGGSLVIGGPIGAWSGSRVVYSAGNGQTTTVNTVGSSNLNRAYANGDWGFFAGAGADVVLSYSSSQTPADFNGDTRMITLGLGAVSIQWGTSPSGAFSISAGAGLGTSFGISSMTYSSTAYVYAPDGRGNLVPIPVR